jgi:ribosome-associated protein
MFGVGHVANCDCGVTGASPHVNPALMRSLADRLNEQAKADADDRELTSRTDRRREQNAREAELKALAVQLVGLKPQTLPQLGLEEQMVNAILLAQAIKSPNARNRQVSVVRQHLRDLGQDALDDIVVLLEARDRGVAPRQPSPSAVESTSPAAAWTERLVAEGDAALEELLQSHPDLDRQVLRQRIRAVTKAGRAATTPELERARDRLRLELQRFLAGVLR